ncbi:uncharacterized protein [Glycine max]|uniref:uncharacterized protein n=1 Tax=Glycine max TaxID=3847 RepID=UPI000E21B53A|nr:uncharacterized protein LOC106794393 [Glycine max]|eukprot:XP_025979703.1 uncharacterized protein LOC106794393 [Glycine max]
MALLEVVEVALKTGLIHLLPKFHGLAGEDPHKHLKEFHIVCSTMKPPDVQEDHIFLKAFPHSLEGVAKDWLYYLAPRSITSWDDLKRVFLEKIFPASRTTAIRKDISGIRQLSGESLYEYWERFKKLCASCPHHQISEQLLLQYFYEGLSNMERSMIDAASGGALGDMTPVEARNLIEKMASNSQQFSARNDAIVIRGVHEVATNPSASSETKKLEGKLDALVNLVTQLALNQKSVPVARLCGLCSSADHHTDLCPSMQQPGAIEQPEAYAANIYNRPPQPQQQNQPQQNNYDLSSNRYNPGWRNHPNLQSLTNQMGQLATQLNQQQSQNSDKLPSQAVQNPKNVSAISLRSGKQCQGPQPVAPSSSANKPAKLHSIPEKGESSSTGNSDLQKQHIPPLPFPPRAVSNKKMEEAEKEILETFRKVEVNIPLLDAIKQIPRYAKFLKELCTNKRKLKGSERISMGRNVSALIGKSVPQIPEKCKDPGTFSIPCIIGNSKFDNAMLDLGASVSVMPLSIFNSLSLGPLQSTDVVIHLANRSVAYPVGFIEDVLVRVGELIFPVDFYILNMEDGFSQGSVPIILGRPFMKTARTKIDVYAGTLSMEFGDITVHFNILDAMKYPSEDLSVFCAEIIDHVVNYGAHFSNVSVGVYGPVQLVALKNNTEVVKDITNNTLNYKVGLHGEIVKLYNPENNKGWNTNGLPTYRVFVWYHLPCSFIREDNQNTLVLFEEFEGHPNEVKFVTVTVDKICANSYEGNMLELSCYEEQVISKIKFASFAVPEDECGSPNALSIQSKVSQRMLEPTRCRVPQDQNNLALEIVCESIAKK